MDRYIKSSSFDMIHLCVNEYNGYHMGGIAYNNTINRAIEFNDIQGLFLELDAIFDINGNPFASSEKRSFKKEKTVELTYHNKPPILNDYSEFLDKEGKLGTVDILVKTRLSSNWQGVIFYGNQQKNFNGVIDLIEKVVYLLKL